MEDKPELEADEPLEADQIDEVVPPKKKGGWPKGRPRKPKDPTEVKAEGPWLYKFVGDPGNDGDGPLETTVWGITFKKGEPTEVTDKWVAERAESNSHFEKV